MGNQGQFFEAMNMAALWKLPFIAVCEGTKYAKEWVTSGKGPMVLEFMTYRYHGHSMSDPGVTYRSRDDVNAVRKTRDPIDLCKQRLLDAGFATKEELKTIDKVRAEVQTAVDFAMADDEAPYEELFNVSM